jgi:hypothetical protein
VALFAAPNCRAGTEGQREPELGLGAASRHPFAEVLAMANDSRIQDATSLLAIYRYQALFGF